MLTYKSMTILFYIKKLSVQNSQKRILLLKNIIINKYR